jgi:hypothetical protein
MDPNASLVRIRTLVAQIQGLQPSGGISIVNLAYDLADAFNDLDDTLSHGGALPAAWSRRI